MISHIAYGESEVLQFAALLRGTESAWQAVSYGLTSLTLFAQVGGVYFNLMLWAFSIYPAWLVVRGFGSGRTKDRQVDQEEAVQEIPNDKSDNKDLETTS